MGTRRARKTVLWLCLLMQAVLGVPAGLGLTLCVDVDGCRAIEIAHAQVECLRPVHETLGEDAGCSLRVRGEPCRDVPVLEGGAYEARVAEATRLPFSTPPRSFVALPVAAPARAAEAIVRRARVESPGILRSVVLTI